MQHAALVGSRAPQKFTSLAVLAVVLCAWGALLRELNHPGLLFGGHNADSAIPVLMANDSTLRVESLYFWRQDRFSGTPFILASLVRRITGHFWQPTELALLQALWIGLSALVIWRWSKRAGPALAWAAILLISGVWTHLLFDIAQPYAYQLTWLLLASWVVAERAANTGFRTWRGALLLSFLAWQAHAANAMSGTWLLAVAVMEIILAAGQRRRVLVDVLVPLLVGVAVEMILRRLFQLRYGMVHGIDVVTPLSLSWDLVRAGMSATWGWFNTWHHISLLGAAVLSLAWLNFHTLPRWLIYPAVFATLNVFQPSWVTHIQRNEVAQKYFTLAAMFASWVLVVSVAMILERHHWWWPWVPATAALAFFVRPERKPDIAYAINASIAQELSKQIKHGIISSGYWETYVVSSLSPNLIPIPRTGQCQRSQHLFDEVARADTVWVGDRGDDGPVPGGIEFTQHAVIGRRLFVPQGEKVVAVGREFRRYRPADVSWFRETYLCPDKPLEVEGEGTLVVFGVKNTRSNPYDAVYLAEGLGAPKREALGFAWPLKGHTRLTSTFCIDTYVYITN